VRAFVLPGAVAGAVAFGIFGIVSGSTQFVWFGGILILYVAGSSFVLPLQGTAAQRRRAAIVSLGCFRLLAVPLAICGLAFNNIQLLLLAVAVLVAVMGSALVISLRDARQSRARVIDGLGAQDHPEK
jgi:hypothetical protein